MLHSITVVNSSYTFDLFRYSLSPSISDRHVQPRWKKLLSSFGPGESGPEGWDIGAACPVTFVKQGALIFSGNRTVGSAAKTRAAIEEITDTHRNWSARCIFERSTTKIYVTLVFNISIDN
ncbi:hypothetical protein LZ31DRAFT_222442 [Colletotrichum somersetense]|nr:hypothetical protein LZ31DRAFT_222442 [Colletotrichum somersetense]